MGETSRSCRLETSEELEALMGHKEGAARHGAMHFGAMNRNWQCTSTARHIFRAPQANLREMTRSCPRCKAVAFEQTQLSKQAHPRRTPR